MRAMQVMARACRADSQIRASRYADFQQQNTRVLIATQQPARQRAVVARPPSSPT
jgi:hypothetical protein